MTYFTGHMGWRPRDFDSYKFVQALKGRGINKYAQVPILGTTRRLEQANAQDAIEWFGELAADYIRSVRLGRPLAFAPVPDSRCIAKATPPRTCRLADAVVSRLQNVEVWDGLRWRTEMIPSSQGGTRDPQRLFDNLAIVRRLPESRIVLIDDVATKGSHLKAAAARLRARDARCNLAVCAAQTILNQDAEVFATVEAELEDFEPE